MNFLHQKINSCFVIKESANLELEDFWNTIFSSIPFILGKYIFMNWWNVGEDLWMSFLWYYHILHVLPFFDNPAIGLKAKVWQFQIGNIPKNCDTLILPPNFYLNHLQNCKWHHGHFRFKMKTLVFRNKILNSFRSFFPTWHGYNCVSSVGVCISIVVLLSIGISIYSVQVVVIIINIIVNIYYLSDIDLLFQLSIYIEFWYIF